MKKSHVLSPSRVWRFIKAIFRHIDKDRLSVHAAQASFFAVIASIPFLMLLISLARAIFPDVIDAVFVELGKLVPSKFSGLFDTVYNEISTKASASVISLAAVTTLWTASRGVAAVTRGVAGIYETKAHSGFFSELFRSIFYTIAFIVFIIALLIVLVFGTVIRDATVTHFPRTVEVFDLIFRLRIFIFFIVLTFFFSLVFLAVSRNGIKKADSSSYVPPKFLAQLPGAALAAAGWMLYSYGFSLYIEFFPSASYIYGSLATIVLFMLWLYFCMIILLVGAEANKLLHILKKK